MCVTGVRVNHVITGVCGASQSNRDLNVAARSHTDTRSCRAAFYTHCACLHCCIVTVPVPSRRCPRHHPVCAQFAPVVCSLSSPAGAALLTIAVCLAAILLSQCVSAWGVRHIPGPWRYPVVGNIPHLVKRPWSRVLQFSRTYGGIFKVYVCVRVCEKERECVCVCVCARVCVCVNHCLLCLLCHGVRS